MLAFVAIFHLNRLASSQLLDHTYYTYGTNNHMRNNIVFVVSEDQVNSLQPIYCQLSKMENASTHVIFIGQKKSASEACNAFIYHLEIANGILEESISTLTFQRINNILNTIQTDVLIHIKDVEDNIMRNINTAIAIISQTKGFVRIAVPLEESKHLNWITDLSIETLKQWNAPKIRIQVITQNRPDSLARLVQSLNSSFYFGDDVPMTMNIDRSADPVTLEYCKTFKWRHGKKEIRHRVVQGGLLPAIVESYYPADEDDYGIILEDDVEVSPFFYIWTKYSILKYKYGPKRSLSGRIFGVSFYNTKVNELHFKGRRPFDPRLALEGTDYPSQTPYLSQVPCSWGAVFFPEIWREFHHYLTARLKDRDGPKLQNITVPECRSNRWSRSWKRFLIELVYLRGYVMLYPNYDNFTSFSTNHAERGTHVHSKNSPIVFGLPLMSENNVMTGLPENRLPEFEKLPVMDLFGNVVSSEEIIRRGHSLHYKISKCPPNDSNEITYDPKDLLCVDEKMRQIATKSESTQNTNF
ncbi:16815_t:CDS:2 [Cetraspora pellucida]|uniref:16815_t:CDS:1 n=1 Tax=Cetraspora pellucida TaxID=1433469 RepID=A0A9N9AH54_9GLOM|nr:16815_t:CDS:2 [Cetraspora pellucida]